jgi:AcrR family transcriptional regulator
VLNEVHYTTVRANLSSVSAPQQPVARRSRATRSDGIRSREAILREASRLATVDGLEGLSIARLADAVGMSKSGLFAHFGSKEELQLATIDAATDVFTEQVIDPAWRASTGLERLRRLVEGFLDHVEGGVFPGGCFFASVAAEVDTHPGPVRDAAIAMIDGWLELLEEAAREAQDAGELEPGEDPAQLAFELEGYMLLANARYVARPGPEPMERARAATTARLAAAGARD